MSRTDSPGHTRTIGGILRRRALRSPGQTAVVAGAERVSFADLDARVDRAASVLQRAGIGRGDRVGLLLRNGLAYCELFYAIGRAGAICCALNHRLSAGEIAHVLADSGASLVIYDPLFEATIADLPDSLAECAMLPLEASGDSYASRLMEPAAAVGNGADPADPLLLVYTSGTTGRPKGALITHDQLFWASLTIGHTADFRSGDVHLLPVPMFHVGGLSFTVHFAHVGATLVIPPAWRADEILALIEAEAVNHFFAVPTMIGDLLAADGFAAERLRSVRWIMSGAAPLPYRLVDSFAAIGIPIQQSYGATETCGPAACVDPASVQRKRDCVGLPFFHTDIRVVLDDGRDAGPDEQGEILIRAPHVFAGYWRNEAATAAAFVDGWFRTGDIGRRDVEGYLYLLDRKSDMIISGGENIYPAEVERILETHPSVAAAAVVGLPHERWGEVVCAVVTPTAGAQPTLEMLAEHCSRHLARYKVPRRLEVRADLPRNATGKVVRTVLRREIAETQGSSC